MKMTFLQSSSVVLEHKETKILTDPWLVDGELYGSWAHYPPSELKPEDFNDVDYIYLSHIHQDHFSQKTLRHMNKDIPIIIHNFASKRLKLNIEKLGFSVIELDHNTRTHLKDDLYINILAADSCNPELCRKYFGCAPMETTFGSTSIDTMSVIDNGDQVIVNTNDCPFELSSDSAKIIMEEYDHIDLALIGYTSSCAYPQCFDMPLDEKLIAKQKLEDEFLLKAVNYVNLFKPKYYMPFAGRYTLAGKLSKLNDYRGVTELQDAYDYYISTDKIDQDEHKCIILNSQSSFDINTGKQSHDYKRITEQEKNDYIKNTLSKVKLDYEYIQDPSDDEILSLIPKSYDRFVYQCNQLNWSSDTIVLIKLSNTNYILITCNGNGWKVISSDDTAKYEKYVKMSLDKRLLKWILMGPRYGHWNQAEGGSHIMYERKPNIYERALFYCMSYFYS